MLKLKIYAAVFLAGAILSAGCSGKEEQPMNSALKHAMAGDWAKADRPSAEAIMKTPDNINALILRALVCERLNRYDEAVENAYKAVTIDGNSFAAVYTLGRLYAADTRRRSDAVNLLIKANRLRSDHPLPLVLLCNLHQPGQKSSYLAALSRIPGWSNAPEVEFESCMNRVYNRDRRGVETAYIRLFNTYPDHPELTSALGGYFYFCRRNDMAKAAFKRYLAFPESRRSVLRTSRAQKRLAALR